MIYEDYIRKFWKFYNKERFAELDLCVYFYLLHQFHLAGWPASINLADNDLSKSLRISSADVIKSRVRLDKRELIKCNVVGTYVVYKIK